MKDIREIEFRDSGSNANTGYVLRFEPLFYVPAFTQKDFHYVHTGPPVQGTSTEEFAITNLECTTPLSNITTSTHEARHKAKNNNYLYTKRDKGSKPNYNLNHLYTKRDSHKPKAQPHLHIEG